MRTKVINFKDVNYNNMVMQYAIWLDEISYPRVIDVEAKIVTFVDGEWNLCVTYSEHEMGEF
ncbi:MAG: hypothetical protein ACRCX8_14305 [Sarcina sp.]